MVQLLLEINYNLFIYYHTVTIRGAADVER